MTTRGANTEGGTFMPAAMSIKTHKRPLPETELYRLLQEGLDAENAGETRPFNEAIADIRKGLSDDIQNNHHKTRGVGH
jgi:hypothetical protein